MTSLLLISKKKDLIGVNRDLPFFSAFNANVVMINNSKSRLLFTNKLQQVLVKDEVWCVVL